jgi:hypothetical protein
MASGVSRLQAGSYIGTGSLLNIQYDKVGFKAKQVKIYRATTGIDICEHVKGMADDSMFRTIGSTGVRDLVTTAAITLLDTGFSVGATDEINNATDKYYYVAEE